MLTTVTRAPEGTARRVVPLASLVVPDFRALAAGHPCKVYRDEMLAYYRDVTSLLFAARIDAEYPREFHVPDLWHAAMTFAGSAQDDVLEGWYMGHDLARALGYKQTGRGLSGSVYVRL